ncbi:SixA phosphatase family protein [Agromyces sp. MMS24-JH15]|uniref:SixA phosphatase family protein n=1 Tax=Agromyces sp. MMS24-JH15 TaxID=3243765 RepID=UPI0037488786
MKTLFLVRHAKSDWGDPWLADHDRPLNARGERDAPATGRRLAERGAAVDVVVTSTAVRARTTARAIAAALGVPEDRLIEDEGLYGASGPSILAVAAGLPDAIGVAMLVGHNPGMSEALRDLTGEWADLPTCAVAECRVDVDAWAELVEGTGALVRLDTPRG